MCIRDSTCSLGFYDNSLDTASNGFIPTENFLVKFDKKGSFCLLYTSDAADERSSVDLGGRRIIKKKNIKEHRGSGER